MSASEAEAVSGGEESGLTREERLELARKKFDEMKKKKKKKSKTKADKGAADDDKAGVDGAPSEESAAPSAAQDTGAEAPAASDSPATTASEEKPLETTAGSDSAAASKIEELQQTVEQQKTTIAKLRDANTDLKLSRMDLEDKIVSLEQALKDLRASGAPSTGNQPSATAPSYVPAKPAYSTNEFADEPVPGNVETATADFRERLMVWRGWQVDMVGWSRSATSQKLSF
ncbi:Piso0_005322 [Millerozyma farinosa CBS 7064]|uniref:Piso0_005322 protein n=1 Tax=Pichia sorbitophila (strain ATCC MYA-4447 / BCRC 22081 / CBS 7064 / NBRC 10061 / NRRL Y-12695) TaxID=559304 RepID=G8Y4T3_PICSO|nr:Piso0_005322 [Millerozyma farinosa CBS 7064]